MNQKEKLLKLLKEKSQLIITELQKITFVIKKDLEKIELPDLSKDQRCHLYNLLALLVPYSLVSALIYPKFSCMQYSQEIFSLICIYYAIFFWFTEKITDNFRLRIVLGCSACAIPIFFANNSFAVALVFTCLMFFGEFICIEYLRGCNLFSSKIPVYVICANIPDTNLIENELNKEYKVLKLLRIEKFEDTSKELDSVKKYLKKANLISFFPFPRRILFCSSEQSIDTAVILYKLSEISSEFSVPLFKVRSHTQESKQELLWQLSPICPQDFDFADISQREVELLADAFKGKHAWIFYDGRKSIFDLILALLEATNLTIFCDSEHLMREIELEIAKKPRKNCKIKIADRNCFEITDTKPEILFFNMPLLHMDAFEDNLKEAVVKNVLSVSDMINLSQKMKIKFVFIMSTQNAANIDNWVGATQRLGEVIAQSVDAKAKKTITKFRVIRLPQCISDILGIFNETKLSLSNSATIKCDSTMSTYCRDEIIHPLIKLIISTLKEQYFLPGVYSIIPESESKNDFAIQTVCNSFSLRKEKDILVEYLAANPNALSEEEAFDFKKHMEKTDIDPAVMRSNFATDDIKSHEIPFWTIEQISNMTTRDMIAAVLQSLQRKSLKKSIK